MCRQRLAADEAPACVQACPSQAIKIRVVNVAQVIARTEANDFLPSAPDARLTRPTTRFLGAAALSLDPQAGDHAVHAPAHAHWPLVFMLVLTQMSLGIVALGHVLSFWLGVLPIESARAIVNGSAALIGASGASLALLHLGRPQIAYRAWLGWRTSWLSREVLAFGIYVPLLLLTAAVSLSPWSQSAAPLLSMLEIACIGAGIVAVYCSAMIYIATRRAWWSARRTLASFGLTAFLLGNSVCTALAALHVAPGESLLDDYQPVLALLVPAMVIVGWRLAGDGKFLRGSLEGLDPAIRDTGELLSNRPLRYVLGYRRLLAFAAAFGCPLLILFLLTTPPAPDTLRIAVAAVCFAGVACLVTAELIGRYLFFAACVPPRMPGGLP